MAFSQVVPKDSDKRKNKPALNDTVLVRRNDDKLIGPDLPLGKAWCKETRQWWDMWRRHEMAPKMEPSDWMHLLDTALLHNEYWMGVLPAAQMVSYAAEIRRRVAAFGATLEDRLKLRIKFANSDENVPNEDGTPKTPGVDYSSLMEE